MSGKKAFFVECKKYKAPDWARCDKCGELIIDIQDGIQFFNPNPNALHRNICRNCYEVWTDAKRKKNEKWLEKRRIYEAEKNGSHTIATKAKEIIKIIRRK